jgi:endonuclease/exonuclease/phosphatase family metal-dependent hydrolase
MDRKMSPEPIARILQGLDADVIGVQEILDVRNGPAELDKAQHLADSLPGYSWCVGETRPLQGGAYGNMTLSRLPIESFRNYDLTHLRRESRGCLRSDLRLDSATTIHAFNLHLGPGFIERRHQVRYLLNILEKETWTAPHIIFGDFNEWTRGLATRNMANVFKTFEPRTMLKNTRPTRVSSRSFVWTTSTTNQLSTSSVSILLGAVKPSSILITCRWSLTSL